MFSSRFALHVASLFLILSIISMVSCKQSDDFPGLKPELRPLTRFLPKELGTLVVDKAILESCDQRIEVNPEEDIEADGLGIHALYRLNNGRGFLFVWIGRFPSASTEQLAERRGKIVKECVEGSSPFHCLVFEKNDFLIYFGLTIRAYPHHQGSLLSIGECEELSRTLDSYRRKRKLSLLHSDLPINYDRTYLEPCILLAEELPGGYELVEKVDCTGRHDIPILSNPGFLNARFRNDWAKGFGIEIKDAIGASYSLGGKSRDSSSDQNGFSIIGFRLSSTEDLEKVWGDHEFRRARCFVREDWVVILGGDKRLPPLSPSQLKAYSSRLGLAPVGARSRRSDG